MAYVIDNGVRNVTLLIECNLLGRVAVLFTFENAHCCLDFTRATFKYKRVYKALLVHSKVNFKILETKLNDF